MKRKSVSQCEPLPPGAAGEALTTRQAAASLRTGSPRRLSSGNGSGSKRKSVSQCEPSTPGAVGEALTIKQVSTPPRTASPHRLSSGNGSGSKKGNSAKDALIFGGNGPSVGPELTDADLILPAFLPFKSSQASGRYPKGQKGGRHWKHLKQILQAETYHLYPPNEPTYVNIESPPSMYPAKKYCDITGFEALYTDPRTKLRYASADVFKRIRSLPDQYIQGFLSMRNAAVVLK